ncbi:MAG: hypothetical protein PHV59_11210 [Victivallales bacterium]|nr:hypothetical protein [Victivallales bacterium]
MDFLKKHYEKLILALLLLVFVFLLFYLIDLSKSTRTITSKNLQIPVKDPNYQCVDFSRRDYQIRYIFTNNCEWQKSKARVDQDNIYSDLLVPYKCARCPFCNKVIPYFFFMGAIDHPRHCPLCDKPLPRPPERDINRPVSEMDRDDDGIPDVDEIKFGLNPDNPDDAFYDMDNDGFPNIYEYKKSTNLQKADSHPPYPERLLLLEFRETLLPFVLKLVNTNGGKKDPADWVIQINENVQDGQIKTRFEYLNSRMKLDNTYYNINKIDAKHIEKRIGGTIVKEDKSKVYLKSTDGEYTITMQVGQKVFSPKPKAVIEDLATGKKYHVGAGDYISMPMVISADGNDPRDRRGRNVSKTVKYRVVKVDRSEKQVIIEDRKLRKYSISAKALMPRVKRKESGQKSLDGRPAGSQYSLEAPPGGP